MSSIYFTIQGIVEITEAAPLQPTVFEMVLPETYDFDTNTLPPAILLPATYDEV